MSSFEVGGQGVRVCSKATKEGKEEGDERGRNRRRDDEMKTITGTAKAKTTSANTPVRIQTASREVAGKKQKVKHRLEDKRLAEKPERGHGGGVTSHEKWQRTPLLHERTSLGWVEAITKHPGEEGTNTEAYHHEAAGDHDPSSPEKDELSILKNMMRGPNLLQSSSASPWRKIYFFTLPFMCVCFGIEDGKGRGAASEAEEPPTPLVWPRPWNFTKRFTTENLSNS
ncbi:hypothetical protein MUK42_33852 [Musa troglodytarum]|uniref:Uncharacterized protein n=1 Tax=Musa troglodytarum TaxID=320322 RepID=A0A9E7G6P3_9LILI|nr:hypothetical protein MUK42_33852 [Musa troglodytarum]